MGGQIMSKVIKAVYTNGVFRPLEPVVLPEGEPVQVHVPEKFPTSRERLAALDAFDAVHEELTEEQWRMFEEAVQRRPWFGGRQPDL
jgi:predicted DNA-binding antitoxin AbrB/MazE fold protein